MTEHNPSEPGPNDFKETADRSLDAGIADESAAYERPSTRTSTKPVTASQKADGSRPTTAAVRVRLTDCQAAAA
jgi:hypothetical protein